MSSIQIITRRSFIRNLGFASGGLILACNFPSSDEKKPKFRTFLGDTFEPNLFIQLKDSGELVLLASRSEMGNGVRTSLTSVIADEMDADWAMVSVIQATGNVKFMDQNTDGSRSIRFLFEPMRKLGATAKAMLTTAAAAKWQVEESELKTENHYVINTGNGKKIFYGDLVNEASKVAIPENPTLKDPKDFKYIGKGLKSIDAADFASGKPKYGMDIKLANMKYAAVSRCPVTFGTVKSFNKTKAMEVAGVIDVVEIPRIEKPFGALGGVAVVATNTWAAFKGKEALEIEWDYGDNKDYNSEPYDKMIKDNVLKKGKENRRRTSPYFLNQYRKILHPNGTVNLKTDSDELYEFTLETIGDDKKCKLIYHDDDIYSKDLLTEELVIKTYYEKMHLEARKTIKYVKFTI